MVSRGQWRGGGELAKIVGLYQGGNYRKRVHLIKADGSVFMSELIVEFSIVKQVDIEMKF